MLKKILTFTAFGGNNQKTSLLAFRDFRFPPLNFSFSLRVRCFCCNSSDGMTPTRFLSWLAETRYHSFLILFNKKYCTKTSKMLQTITERSCFNQTKTAVYDGSNRQMLMVMPQMSHVQVNVLATNVHHLLPLTPIFLPGWNKELLPDMDVKNPDYQNNRSIIKICTQLIYWIV